MDAAEIDCSVVSLSPTLFLYHLSESEASDFARRANTALAEWVAESDRLTFIATLPMSWPDLAVSELERATLELGARGAVIGTQIGSRTLDSPQVLAVLAAAEDLDVAVFIHPVAFNEERFDFGLDNALGYPYETCLAAARLICSGALDRLPEVKLVLSHGGGFLPYQIGRLDQAFEKRSDNRLELDAKPSNYLSRFWVDTITLSDRSLSFVADLMTVNRLLLGTDRPFDMADAESVPRVRRVGIDPDALGANASLVFQLGSAV
jgi:aminocarboxymuconate-semialdehyde decarboxylase